MDESDQIRIARATRQSRVRWANSLIALGVLVAVVGALVYSSRKSTTLADASADTTLALQCYDGGASCGAETSAERHAREARPFLIGGLAGGGALLVLGVVLLATAPAVPKPRSAVPAA